MRKRPLGETGLTVSELGLGTWGLSGDAYGAVAPEDQDAVIDRALALGVTLFETADSYGKGEMEKRLGERLATQTEIAIATKVGTDRGATPPRKRFDATYVKEAVERSRERLERPAIEIVLLHNPSLQAIERPGAVEALLELKEKALIRAWGVSAGSPEVAKAALDRGAEVLEIAHNVFHQRELEHVAAELETKKAGILARSVLAHGLLSGHWPTTKQFPRGDHRRDRWTPDELKKRIMQLSALRPSVAGGVPSLRAVALRFVLANPAVSSAILGPRSMLHLDQLVREAGSEPYLGPEALAALKRRLEVAGVKS